MLGYDISWAAFNIIEVMSSTKFTFKVIAHKIMEIFEKILIDLLNKSESDIWQHPKVFMKALTFLC